MAGPRPDLLAVFGTQRPQTAACTRAKHRIASRPQRSGPRLRQIGDRCINLLAIAGHSPLDTSVDAAFPDTSLPKDLALLVRVQSIDDAGFLSGSQDVSTVC